MLRHPEKRANIKALAAHFHLIEEKGVEENDVHDAADDYDSDDDDDGDEYDDEHERLDFGLGQSYSTESASGGGIITAMAIVTVITVARTVAL